MKQENSDEISSMDCLISKEREIFQTGNSAKQRLETRERVNKEICIKFKIPISMLKPDWWIEQGYT